jgi:orotidine-5'-phosphate decarboxylase
MNRTELIASIQQKRSFLCIGLDTDLSKIPAHLLKEEDPIFEFNRQIIDATHDLTVAYKPNLAFYECYGLKGWQSLTKTAQYLNQFNVFMIADAKRGDIGNTSTQYAKAFFDTPVSGLDFDAVTVAPYMGEDSVKPFLGFPGKWAVILALTSNKGAENFQFMTDAENGSKLFESVLTQSQQWGSDENIMYVVGATKADMLTRIREIVPNHFLLVPGVGAQGGSLSEVARYGITKECGLLVNSSRNIIYASNGEDFAIKAREETLKMQKEMEAILAGINH